MPKPYSYDLRLHVIQAIEFDGLKKSEARGYCSISVAIPSTCGVTRLAVTGDFQGMPNQPPGNGHSYH